MGAVLRELVFRVMYTLFPGGGLSLSQWEQFGTSMVWCTFVAAGIGWLVMMVLARTRPAGAPPEVFRLNRPYRWGLATAWIVIAVWAIVYILVMYAPIGKARAFLHPNTFLLLLVSGLWAWSVYAIISSIVYRLTWMMRYKYVTLINRTITRGF